MNGTFTSPKDGKDAYTNEKTPYDVLTGILKLSSQRSKTDLKPLSTSEVKKMVNRIRYREPDSDRKKQAEISLR